MRWRNLVVSGFVCLLVGCTSGGSGDGASSSTAPATTAQATSTVDTTQIGGTGLTILSAQQASAPVKNGTFTTTVSTKGPQLLFVQDSTGSNRGLTISLPSNQAAPSIMTTDATSTALALLFLSPGVITSDTAQAQQIFTALQQMTSFAPFVAFLQTNLPTRSLNDLVQDATYQSLLNACLTEWPTVAAALPAIQAASIRSAAAFAVAPQVTPFTTPPSWQTGSVILTVPPGYTGASDLQATLSNYALRCVTVYEVLDLNGDGFTLSSVGSPIQVRAALGVSWLNIATGKIGTPTSTTVSTPFSNANVMSNLLYYVVGWGLAPSTVTLPTVVGSTLQNSTACGLRDVTNYFIGPLVTFVAGETAGNTVENLITGGELLNDLSNDIGVANTIYAISSAATVGGLTLALVDEQFPNLITEILSKLQKLLQNEATSLVLGLFDPLGKVMTAANISLYATNLLTLPSVARIKESSPYDTLQFSAPSYSAKKTAGQTQITVTRTDGSNDPLTVQYSISGTAIAGQDYTDVTMPTPGSLQFANGQPSANISLNILNNPANTSSCQATISLGQIKGLGKLGTPSTATLMIDPVFDGAYTSTTQIDTYTHTESNTVLGNSVTGFHSFTDGTTSGSFTWTGTLTITSPTSATITGSGTINNVGIRSFTIETGGIDLNPDGSARMSWTGTDPVFGPIGGVSFRGP